MSMTFDSYESIKNWKDREIRNFSSSMSTLNHFHDQVMELVFLLAIQRINLGSPPCSFCWFQTGSGGRFEQGLISDQDHGLVYAVDSAENDAYFLSLGQELSEGLNIVGYPYCGGNIMSSNPLWCQSFSNWKRQLQQWIEDNTWDSIRYLQIFFDARGLGGDYELLKELKTFLFSLKEEHPELLNRLIENVTHFKKAFGPLGQILTEEKGKYYGSVNLKYAAFLPYVNAIRILAIKESIYETSTLDRMGKLLAVYPELHERNYYQNFEMLLKYRLSLINIDTYDDTHYLNVQVLSKQERNTIKKILLDGKKLHQFVQSLHKRV